jgi:hypothetical protein
MTDKKNRVYEYKMFNGYRLRNYENAHMSDEEIENIISLVNRIYADSSKHDQAINSIYLIISDIQS